ncbi:UNVERIFIED_CONTAM: hypothetical protein HDU68_003965, partial [Siphonaria sp. JEL0065]
MGKKSQTSMLKAPKRLKSQAKVLFYASICRSCIDRQVLKAQNRLCPMTKYVKPEIQILGDEIALALDQDSIRVFRQTNRAIRSAFEWNTVTHFADLTQLDQELENSS